MKLINTSEGRSATSAFHPRGRSPSGGRQMWPTSRSFAWGFLRLYGCRSGATLAQPDARVMSSTSFSPYSVEVYQNLLPRGKRKYMGVYKRHAYSLIVWLNWVYLAPLETNICD